ncbi:MAG: dienelactone hydrolase family protein [Chitinophagaceae bacterium]
MKNIVKGTTALLLTLCVAMVACKKSDATDTQQPTENPNNNVVETQPAVQKGITVDVNSNIGGYMQALPALYDSTTKTYPMIVFIHGIGELGNGSSNLSAAANNGTPALIKNKKFPASFTVNGKSYSFIVISPQFKAWPSSDDVNAMVNYAIAKYRVDTTRIYISGLSMGGGVTWDYGAAYAKRIAAIVPICGASSVSDTKAKQMLDANLPVWAFHNEDDPTVSVNNSKGWVTKLNSLNINPAAKLTLWATGGHDAWTKATNPDTKENNMNMYEWMLQYTRASVPK